MRYLRLLAVLSGGAFIVLATVTGNHVFYGPEKIADQGLHLVLKGQLSELPGLISESYEDLLGEPDNWVDTSSLYAGKWNLTKGEVESPAQNSRTVVYEITRQEQENVRPMRVEITLESAGINPLLGRAWKISGGLPLYRLGLEKSELVSALDSPSVEIFGSPLARNMPAEGLLVGPHPLVASINASDSNLVQTLFYSFNPADFPEPFLTMSVITWNPELHPQALTEIVSLSQRILSTCAATPEKVSMNEEECATVRISPTTTDAKDFGSWSELSCSILTMPTLAVDEESYLVATTDKGKLRCVTEEGTGFLAEASLSYEVEIAGSTVQVKAQEQ